MPRQVKGYYTDKNGLTVEQEMFEGDLREAIMKFPKQWSRERPAGWKSGEHPTVPVPAPVPVEPGKPVSAAELTAAALPDSAFPIRTSPTVTSTDQSEWTDENGVVHKTWTDENGVIHRTPQPPFVENLPLTKNPPLPDHPPKSFGSSLPAKDASLPAGKKGS